MARCPQRVHSSRCPPSAAVRHWAIARSTLTCFQVIHLRFRSMNVPPAARTRSATSNRGRSIYWSCGDLALSFNESRGLAVAFRWRCERCNRWWFLPDHDSLTGSGWFVDRRGFPGGVTGLSWARRCRDAKNSCGAIHFSGQLTLADLDVGRGYRLYYALSGKQVIGDSFQSADITWLRG